MSKFTLDKLPKRVLAKIDVQTAYMVSRCIIAAERFRLFRKLEGKELTSSAIGRLTGIRGWRREPFLAALIGLGLLKKKGKLYSNSTLASKYFVRERSKYWTDIYSSECIEEYRAFSVLEEMLTTGRNYESILGIKRKYYVDLMKENKKWANDFTHMLYYYHQPHADALVRHVNLSKHERLLDVGGGSGVMSIALAKKFPHLKATILDIEPVCRTAKKIISQQGLSKRIKTKVGDINDNLPTGYDIIMFCDIGRINQEILIKAYNSLPKDGLLIFVDSFASEDLTDPFLQLMWQLRSDSFWLTTRKEAISMVRKCGFKSVKLSQIHDELWLITGYKRS